MSCGRPAQKYKWFHRGVYKLIVVCVLRRLFSEAAIHVACSASNVSYTLHGSEISLSQFLCKMNQVGGGSGIKPTTAERSNVCI